VGAAPFLSVFGRFVEAASMPEDRERLRSTESAGFNGASASMLRIAGSVPSDAFKSTVLQRASASMPRIGT